jgi:hypothetical protein
MNIEIGEVRVHFLSFSWQDPGRIIRICRLYWPPSASTLPVRLRNVEKFLNIEIGEVRVHYISFSFAGPGTKNPNIPLVLASASFDSSVRRGEV